METIITNREFEEWIRQQPTVVAACQKLGIARAAAYTYMPPHNRPIPPTVQRLVAALVALEKFQEPQPKSSRAA